MNVYCALGHLKRGMIFYITRNRCVTDTDAPPPPMVLVTDISYERPSNLANMLYQFYLLTFKVYLDNEPVTRKLLHDTSTQNGEVMLRTKSI